MAPDAAEQGSAQGELRVTQSIINLGLLSREQMDDLLSEQARLRESGHDVSLRQLCLRKRLISLDQFANAVRSSGIQPPPAKSEDTQANTTCDAYPGDEDETVGLTGGTVPDIGGMRPPVPRRLGRYEIMGEIGRGGMAIIYGAMGSIVRSH
jgi:hypothetical protein